MNLAQIPHCNLTAAVWDLVAQIPPGRVSTYGDIAAALGDDQRRAARWVGELLAHHEHSASCPCHRVVRAGGELGLHVSGDSLLKARELTNEGVSFTPPGRVDAAHFWNDFRSDRPLAVLRQWQMNLASRVEIRSRRTAYRTCAGLDVAYPQPDLARGAYVLLEIGSGEVLKEITVQMPIDFPYLPGYLTFRELPVLLELCRIAQLEDCWADVLFVDGNGQLHPWRAGIATCLGVMVHQPTIGVGKSLLCGRVVDEVNSPSSGRIVLDGDDVLAVELRNSRSLKGVYVSVGNLIALPHAAELTAQLQRGHRLPEPVRLADKLTKRSA